MEHYTLQQRTEIAGAILDGAPMEDVKTMLDPSLNPEELNKMRCDFWEKMDSEDFLSIIDELDKESLDKDLYCALYLCTQYVNTIEETIIALKGKKAKNKRLLNMGIDLLVAGIYTTINMLQKERHQEGGAQ